MTKTERLECKELVEEAKKKDVRYIGGIHLQGERQPRKLPLCEVEEICKEGLNIVYTNMDSFVNKRTEFNLFLKDLANRPDVISATEVNPKRKCIGLRGEEFTIVGYEMFSVHNIG